MVEQRQHGYLRHRHHTPLKAHTVADKDADNLRLAESVTWRLDGRHLTSEEVKFYGGLRGADLERFEQAMPLVESMLNDLEKMRAKDRKPPRQVSPKP